MDMVEVNVLVSTRVSDDGISTRPITKGTTDKVRSELFAGLEAEGYVSAFDALQTNEDDQIEIPDDWQKQHHLKIIAMGKKLDPAVTDKASAIAAIEAELSARKA
jgi:hypothetical protein